MNKLIITLILAVLAIFVWRVAIVDAKQETCPKDNGWTKVDDLSGFTYTFTVPEGYEVTDNCYKAATDVVYGSGDTVTAEDKYELSHASFKLVEKEEPEPPVEPPVEPEIPPVDEPEPPVTPPEEPEVLEEPTPEPTPVVRVEPVTEGK